MLNRYLLAAVFGVLALFLPLTASAVPKVVASIKPIHSLVAGVMHGVGEPGLIIRGVSSPHYYQLRPSAAAKLENASVIFWVGEPFETFLQKSLTILGRNAHVVTLTKTKEIRLLHNRKGGAWENHDEQQGTHAGHTEHEIGRGYQQFDPHLWLDPENAKKVVESIVVKLSAVDPANAVIYASNGDQLKRRLQMLDLALAKRLRPVRDTPYVLFHDAYQYLERRYGLNAVGSITISPERQPSAQRLKALRLKIKELDARCVFGEPQFETALVEIMIEGTSAKRGILDPLGSTLKPGPNAYFDMMNANVSAIVDCLLK